MAELATQSAPVHDQFSALSDQTEFLGMAVDSRHTEVALENAPVPKPSSSEIEENGGVERKTDDASGDRDEVKLSSKDVGCNVNELRLRSSTIDQLSRNETELRIKMYFHISNPLNRWRKFRYVTWKFFLQLAKTFCIAAQVCKVHTYTYYLCHTLFPAHTHCRSLYR